MTESSTELITKKDHKDKNIILLLGIGIFGWIAIGSFAYFFRYSLKDIFFNINVEPISTFWIVESINLLIYTLGVILLIKIVRNSSMSEIKILIFVILFIVLGQLLQFIEPLINDNYRTADYFTNIKEFNDLIIDNRIYTLISIAFEIVIYILTAILIYLKRK